MSVRTEQDDLLAFERKFKRQLVFYDQSDKATLYAVYADKALTGFLTYLHEPEFGKFESTPVLLFPLKDWVRMKSPADETATTMLILARGRTLKVGFWRPHTGLLYAVRDVEGTAMMHITTEEFKDV